MMTETTQREPQAITPVDISLLTNEEIDNMLEGIRFRRMQARVIYEETLKTKEVASRAKVGELIDKKCAQLKRAIDAMDKPMEKLEKIVNEVRALRLQMGEPDL